MRGNVGAVRGNVDGGFICGVTIGGHFIDLVIGIDGGCMVVIGVIGDAGGGVGVDGFGVSGFGGVR